MKRLAELALALFAIFALAGQANAQFSPLLWAAPAGGACTGGFTSVGDLSISGVVGFYGLRSWSCATAGSKVANICNATDANCADVNSTAAGGLDTTAAAGAPLNCGGTGGTCTIKTFYELSGGGGGNPTQATIANRATLSFNCVNTSLPCAIFGTNTIYTSGAAVASANVVNFGLVFNDSAGGTGTQRNLVGLAATYQLRLSGGAGSVFCSPDTTNLNPVSTSVWHTALAVCAAISGTYIDYVDNSALTGGAATGTGITGDVIQLGQGTASGNNDKITEAFVFAGSAGLTSGNATSICHNERLYWGTAGSC